MSGAILAACSGPVLRGPPEAGAALLKSPVFRGVDAVSNPALTVMPISGNPGLR